MRLYLHIGTEKTGSSHLQSVAAVNRERLIKDGIYFPEGKLESQMRNWEISDGNAQSLTDYLKSEDFAAVEHFFRKKQAEAKKNGCKNILLSNELLVLALNNEERLKKLTDIAFDTGFTTVHALLIIRDPIDQALSLYRHRAKGGTAPPIEEWPASNYLYGEGLLRFLQTITKVDIKVCCRKYTCQDGVLDQIFFHEWLGSTQTLVSPPMIVNPSLTISELELIRQIHQYKPWLSRELYNKLVATPKREKAREPKITSYYKKVLYNYLKVYQSTWDICNLNLPANEQISFKVPEGAPFDIEDVATFSVSQCKVIAAFADETTSLSFLPKRAKITLKYFLRKINLTLKALTQV